MAETVDLILNEPCWGETGRADIAHKAVNAALQAAGIGPGDYEVAVLACNDAEIATLNSRFRGKSSATNVLSWPAHDLFADLDGGAPSREIPADAFEATALGDIAIAYETVLAEAQAGHIPVDHHIFHLILHGTLHLLGYDHQREADASRMEALEIEALGKAGIPSPYA